MMRVQEFIYRYTDKVYVRLISAVIVLIFLIAESLGGRNDLDIFLAASVDLFQGKNIYGELYFDGYHYYYSVLFATCIYPLTVLPVWLSKAIWIVLNLIFLWRIVKIMRHYLDEDEQRKQMFYVLTVLVILFSLRFIRGNLHFGQMTIMILYFSLEAIWQNERNRSYLSALLFALAINIKLLPLVFIPYLVYRAYWKSAALTCVFVILLYLIPVLWIGFDQNFFLFHEWWQLINPAQTRHILDVDETSFHSLTTFCATLFSDIREHNGLEIRRHIVNLSVEHIALITSVLRALLIIFTLWFLRSKPFTRSESRIHTWWEVSYLFLLIPLIFPHQQHYAFMMTFPALAYLIRTFLHQGCVGGKNKIGCLVLLFCVLTFNLSLLYGPGNAIYNHFKILTWGSIFLLILLSMATPARSRTERS